MHYLKAFFVWLLIILAESINGTLRQLFLVPLINDLTARQISFFSGMVLIFLMTWLFIRWIHAPTFGSLLITGLMWTVLTILFEFGLGVFVFGFSWKRMLEDYDIFRGGLMGFGLLFMTLVPTLAAKTRRII